MRRLTCLLTLVAVLTSQCFAVGQERERSLNWQSNPPSCPGIEGDGGKVLPTDIRAFVIVSITVAGKPVEVGRPFVAGDDWLRDLKVRVRNVSGLPIASAGLGFNLPEAKEGEAIISVSLSWKGQGEKRLVHSGEEFVLSLTEESYERNRRWIAESTGVTSITRVMIGSGGVIFEDGRRWVGWPRMSGDQVTCLKLPAA